MHHLLLLISAQYTSKLPARMHLYAYTLPMTSLAVYTANTELHTQALALAGRLALPCIFQPDERYDSLLILTPDYLGLQQNGEKSHPLYVDFLSGKMQYRCQHATMRNETLVRAMGLKKNTSPTLIDATTGLGRDSFLLASLGFNVTSLERSPIIFELLQDGLARALQHPKANLIAQHLQLIHTDAIAWLKQAPPANIIYLDPMFPERKKSALVKKEMRFFHPIVGDDVDADLLLQTALTCATQRVVVKRPRLAQALKSERKPSFVLTGSSSRFDIYLTG